MFSGLSFAALMMPTPRWIWENMSSMAGGLGWSLLDAFDALATLRSRMPAARFGEKVWAGVRRCELDNVGEVVSGWQGHEGRGVERRISDAGLVVEVVQQ